MNVIFLDIDGVLNCETTEEKIRHSRGIENEKLKLLKEIRDVSNSEIVLISSWKDEPANSIYRKYLVEKLAAYGMKIYAETEEEHWSLRVLGIRDFLEKSDVDNFVILDDTEFRGYNDEDLRGHWIHTEETDAITGQTSCGLKKEHVDIAIKILGQH